MKKLLIPLLALLPFFAQAQFKSKATAIYFNPAADSLDYKARFSLDSLAKLAPQGGDYQIYITAYTDDQGTAADNLALADRRANSTGDYLSQAGLKPKKQESRAAGELALKSSNVSPTAQRAQMRRVEIQIDYAQPQNLEDWYNYQAQKNTQQFNIASLDKSKVIFGKKGTRLTIPAQAFQRKADKGAPALPITFELREAYTFGDMLAQNLSTTSQSDILETGGMIYIAAKDAKGNALELRPNKDVEIAMPQQTKGELPTNMMLFTADRAGDHNNEPSIWDLSQQPFTPDIDNTAIFFNNISSFEDVTADVVKKIYPAGLDISQLIPKNKISRPDSFTLRPPVSLAISKTRYKSRKALKIQYPRQTNEKAKAYKSRFNSQYKIYKLKRRAEKRNKAINAKNLQSYKEQFAEYQRQKNAHQIQLQQYNAYQDSLYHALHVINKHFLTSPANLDPNTTLFYTHRHHEDWLKSRKNTLRNFPLNNYEFIKADILGADLNRPEFAALKIRQDSLIAAMHNLNSNYEQLDKSMINLSPLALSIAFDSSLLSKSNSPTINKITKTYDRFLKEYRKNNQSFEEHCEEIFSSYAEVFKNNPDTERYINDIQNFNNSPFAQLESNAFACQVAHKELRRDYKNLKLALGEVSDTEARYLISTTYQLGWINCDRFNNYKPSELSPFSIPHPNDNNTQFFVVIPANASILVLDQEGNNFTAKRIPNELEVKVIGLSVANGQISIAISQGKAANLNNKTLSFRPCTLAEATQAFAKI